MQKIRKITILLVVLFLSISGLANASEATEDKKFNAGEMIMHHIGDAHEWHLTTIGHTHLTAPLPVILYSSKGLEIFSSAKFVDSTGHTNLINGSYTSSTTGIAYNIHHDKIHAADESLHVYDFSITKNVASLMLCAVIMLVLFIYIASRYKKGQMIAPKGVQSFFEPIILFIQDDLAKSFIGEKKYKRYLPYLLTVFFFIWFNNMLGLIPGGANLTGNIAITLTLAIITFLLTNLSGNGHYWKHILWTPGVPLPLRIIILPIEIVGLFVKPVSLMIRLFANITAGHIIILSFISLIFIFESVFFSPVTVVFGIFMTFMELFVAILQAYIFTMLSAMYIGSAVEDHGHPDHDHGH